MPLSNYKILAVGALLESIFIGRLSSKNAKLGYRRSFPHFGEIKKLN